MVIDADTRPASASHGTSVRKQARELEGGFLYDGGLRDGVGMEFAPHLPEMSCSIRLAL